MHCGIQATVRRNHRGRCPTADLEMHTFTHISGYQSEGCPRRGYFFPVRVGRWGWPGHQSYWHVVVAAVVGVISPNARFSKEQLERIVV